MKWLSFLRNSSRKRYLRDYIRLVIAFFGCLLLLACYQQLRLYSQGVLEGIINKNLFLLLVHHLGFASLSAFMLAFLFNALERRKPGWGFGASAGILMGLLLLELLLTEYFLDRYELLGLGYRRGLSEAFTATQLLLPMLLGLIILGTAMRLFYKTGKRFYRLISRMYPFTIVLFSVFLATLFSERRPVNLNKTQFLLEENIGYWSREAPYSGTDEFPFWDDWEPADPLGPYLEWGKTPPNVIILAIEGLSTDFVGGDAPFKNAAPFLDSLRLNALYWDQFLSNDRDSRSTLASLTASMPGAGAGLLGSGDDLRSNSLFAILKKNGYRTSYQFGGNSALSGADRFLFSQRVDEIADQKSFSARFNRQDADAAGVSLGYPDEALFARYFRTRPIGPQPRLDYLQTLSTAEPFAIPDRDAYLERASNLLPVMDLDSRHQRLFRKNRDLMAAMIYADRQLAGFFKELGQLPGFRNTIVVLTGTHRPAVLAPEGPLERYRVPFLLYSPMLKKPGVVHNLASHLDLAPSLLGSLARRYGIELPQKSAWIGGERLGDSQRATPRIIPFYRNGREPQTFIEDSMLLDGADLYRIGARLQLREYEGTEPSDLDGKALAFRAAERYVLEQNALLPAASAPYPKLIEAPEKKDLVWIHSVFSGDNFDNAYATARQLALEGNRERARLLCRYILTQVPGHVDAEILLGRIYAWDNEFERASEILEHVVQKYPVYADGYSALLDTYYWCGANRKALNLQPIIRENHPENAMLREKMDRALKALTADAGNEEWANGELYTFNTMESE